VTKKGPRRTPIVHRLLGQQLLTVVVHVLVLAEEFLMYRMYRMIVEMYVAIFLPSNCIYTARTVEVTYIKTDVFAIY